MNSIASLTLIIPPRPEYTFSPEGGWELLAPSGDPEANPSSLTPE